MTDIDTPLADAPSFIETQFPVAKISIESYKERKAGNGQTLTGLGKWWGRKPLILVRAALLGLLLPATGDPEKDREIFLKLLTMDAEGLRLRKSKPIPGARLLEVLRDMPPNVQKRFLDHESQNSALLKLTKDDKAELQSLVFERMTYAEKITYCDRPEQVEGSSERAWEAINAHLGTHAKNLSELVQELGKKRFGHNPRVGDAFCGGGSIPFEAARMGCDAYGSDLNPIAALLTWASLNVIGGDSAVEQRVRGAVEEVYCEVDREITEWGIEHNSLGWRADVFLYCVEVKDPETGWLIPLLPTFVIADRKNMIVKLITDEKNKRYDIRIEQGMPDEVKAARDTCTVKDSRVYPPNGKQSTPIEILRQNLRPWGPKDFMPYETDIFQERLYCIRWVETYEDEKGKLHERRHYRAPTNEDLKREEKIVNLLKERFSVWQETGILPSRKIEPGEKTNEPIRTRGWQYWHQLFNPRQLLTLGLLTEMSLKVRNQEARVACLLGVDRSVDNNSRLVRWNPTPGKECVIQTYGNQALNTLYNYASSGLTYLNSMFFVRFPSINIEISSITKVKVMDGRMVSDSCDVWITDPPYADAVNYHELTEFFLSWQEKQIPKIFPDWYTDSKRALAVRGSDENFRRSMVDCYKNLAKNMPDNGMQIVMFTHQDASVWADLSMILWAAGLRVTAAWTIATETDSALKAGNYVQGTVLLVLRKRTETELAFLDEVNRKVEIGVREQLDSMKALDDGSDKNFGDSDYQLAAYAAALRALTQQPIDEIDPEKELLCERKSGEVGTVEALIRRAVKIACDHLIPQGLNADLWKSLGPMERFYIKGLEVESHGEYRSGVYQELARGFGAADYSSLLESGKANETRLKSAGEFGKKMIGTHGASESFADSLVRQCLFAIWLTVKNEDARDGATYLRTEMKDAYWTNREKITGLLDYLGALRHAEPMAHWVKDSEGASLLAGAVRNDHV